MTESMHGYPLNEEQRETERVAFGKGHVRVISKDIPLSQKKRYPRKNPKLQGRRRSAGKGEIIIGGVGQLQTDKDRYRQAPVRSKLHEGITHTLLVIQKPIFTNNRIARLLKNSLQ